MGLKKGASAIYLTIVNGKLARRFKTPTAETITRTTKEGSVVHEEYFKSIDGRITGLDLKFPPEGFEHWGDTLMVYMKSDNDMYCVQMQMNGRYAMNFLKTLLNVNLNEDVELTPSEKKLEGDKKDQTIFIRQGGQPIKRYYTKDNPQGLPEPEKKKKRGGKEQWIWDDVIEFLEVNVYEPVKDALKNIYGASTPVVAKLPEVSDEEYIEEYLGPDKDFGDDLPS